jgi:hypothetical protein
MYATDKEDLQHPLYEHDARVALGTTRAERALGPSPQFLDNRPEAARHAQLQRAVDASVPVRALAQCQAIMDGPALQGRTASIPGVRNDEAPIQRVKIGAQQAVDLAYGQYRASGGSENRGAGTKDWVVYGDHTQAGTLWVGKPALYRDRLLNGASNTGGGKEGPPSWDLKARRLSETSSHFIFHLPYFQNEQALYKYVMTKATSAEDELGAVKAAVRMVRKAIKEKLELSREEIFKIQTTKAIDLARLQGNPYFQHNVQELNTAHKSVYKRDLVDDLMFWNDGLQKARAHPVYASNVVSQVEQAQFGLYKAGGSALVEYIRKLATPQPLDAKDRVKQQLIYLDRLYSHVVPALTQEEQVEHAARRSSYTEQFGIQWEANSTGQSTTVTQSLAGPGVSGTGPGEPNASAEKKRKTPEPAEEESTVSSQSGDEGSVRNQPVVKKEKPDNEPLPSGASGPG